MKIQQGFTLRNMLRLVHANAVHRDSLVRLRPTTTTDNTCAQPNREW